MSDGATYSIGDLADAAGVSRRTVRFYVQRELLPAPEGLGRGARYTGTHLARLIQIKEWQEQGVALEEIRRRLESGQSSRAPMARWPPPAADLPGSAWFRQPLAAGYELHVAAVRRPLTAHQLARLAGALGDIVDNGGEEE